MSTFYKTPSGNLINKQYIETVSRDKNWLKIAIHRGEAPQILNVEFSASDKAQAALDHIAGAV